MMPTPRGSISVALAAVLLGAVVVVGGCGMVDGVELQGGVFDALGVSGNALAAKGKEPQVAARPGIVLPPVPDRLPEPGAGAPDLTQMLPNDEDERRVRAVADAERKQKEFCEKARVEARVRGDGDAIIQGPRGPCTPSLLGQTLQNVNQPSKQ